MFLCKNKDDDDDELWQYGMKSVFLIHERTLPWQTIFCSLIHTFLFVTLYLPNGMS